MGVNVKRTEVIVPQVKYIDKVIPIPKQTMRPVPQMQTVPVPKVTQRHVPTVVKVPKTVEVPRIEYKDQVVQIPVRKQNPVPMLQKTTKRVEVPRIMYKDRIVEVPVTKHRHVPMVSTVQKMVEVPVVETIEKEIEVPVVNRIEIPMITTIEKIVEVPQTQIVEKVVEVPVQGRTIQGSSRHVTAPLQPQRHALPPEVVTVMEEGPPLPTEKTNASKTSMPARSAGKMNPIDQAQGDQQVRSGQASPPMGGGFPMGGGSPPPSIKNPSMQQILAAGAQRGNSFR